MSKKEIFVSRIGGPKVVRKHLESLLNQYFATDKEIHDLLVSSIPIEREDMVCPCEEACSAKKVRYSLFNSNCEQSPFGMCAIYTISLPIYNNIHYCRWCNKNLRTEDALMDVVLDFTNKKTIDGI